jgi:hypothetical protein
MADKERSIAEVISNIMEEKTKEVYHEIDVLARSVEKLWVIVDGLQYHLSYRYDNFFPYKSREEMIEYSGTTLDETKLFKLWAIDENAVVREYVKIAEHEKEKAVKEGKTSAEIKFREYDAGRKERPILISIGEALEEKGSKVSFYEFMGSTYIEFSWERENQNDTVEN